MSDKDTGGSAFPVQEIQRMGLSMPSQHGMTLRDYFAAKAMQAFLTRDLDGNWNFAAHAYEAYQMADAMIQARKA